MEVNKQNENQQDFVFYINQVVQDLDNSVKNPNLSQTTKTANGLKALYDLYDLCLVDIISLILYREESIGNVMKELHGSIKKIVSKFHGLLQNPMDDDLA